VRRKGSRKANEIISSLKREEWFKRYAKRKQEQEQMKKEEKENKGNGEKR
jgi:hypothetical protein